MLTKIAAPGCVFLLAILGVYCIPRYMERVSAELRDRASAHLKAAEIGGVIVTPDGRDLTLRGNVSNGAYRAGAASLALAVPGVRAVRNELMVVESLPQAQPPHAQGPSEPNLDTVQTELNGLLGEGAVRFENGKARIEPSSHPILDEIARVLREAPVARARVEGHTDNGGQADYNKTISLSRAQAVVDYLVQQGIGPDRLEAVGVGQERPAAPNDTRVGRMKNRRVEIIVR